MSFPGRLVGLAGVVLLAASLAGAPSARSMEGRTRAIDLVSEGQVLERQGDVQGAYGKYYESVMAAPSPSAYYHLGRLARQAGQGDTARQWLMLALQLNPSFELAKVELGQLDGGARGASPVVSAVTSELDRTVAPGTVDRMNAPMNVDALRREVVTMQSLAPPEKLGSRMEDEVVAEAQVPSSPQDIVLSEPTGEVNREVSDVLSPTVDPSDYNSLPSLGGNGDGLPDTAALNEAAFGEESQKNPGSKGYGQETKVALGTFAFHREKGDDYRGANRWEDAAVEYKMALELNPADTETRTLLAEMYGRIGSAESAQAQFKKAKAEAPNDDMVYYREGNAYFDDQKYDLAIGSYRQALELNPSNKQALNNIGVAYMEKKDYLQAAEKFKEVLKLDDAYDMAILNLGIIYDEHIVDPAQALKYYDRYLELGGPRSPEVQRWATSIRSRMSSE